MNTRADLPFLRRRARPGRGVPVQAAVPSGSVGTNTVTAGSRESVVVRNPTLAAFVSSRSAVSASANPSVDETAGSRRGAASAAPGQRGSAALGPRSSVSGAGSLDSLLGLGEVSPAPPSSRFRPLPPALPGVPSIPQGEDRILRRASAPVVMLNRTQSGTGSLQCVLEGLSGDYVLGCAYETDEGKEGAVHRGMAPSRRRPMLLATDTTVTVDLRQIAGLRRLLVYASSASAPITTWEGTLVVSTLGGQKIYVPCSGASPSFALMSIYNVDGHLVIRAEHEPVAGPPQQVCEAYDYDHILWRDGFTPFTTDSSGH